MSTKIYEFYKYKGKNVYVLQTWLLELREKHKQKKVTYLGGLLDSSAMKDHRKFFDTVHLIEKDTKGTSRSPFAIDGSVVVYFDKENNIYLQFFGVDAALYEKEPFLEDFHYQNQTDKPDEISDEAWRMREEKTDEIFGEDAIPSRAGFTWILADEHDAYYYLLEVRKLHV